MFASDAPSISLMKLQQMYSESCKIPYLLQGSVPRRVLTLNLVNHYKCRVEDCIDLYNGTRDDEDPSIPVRHIDTRDKREGALLLEALSIVLEKECKATDP